MKIKEIKIDEVVTAGEKELEKEVEKVVQIQEKDEKKGETETVKVKDDKTEKNKNNADELLIGRKFFDRDS